MLSGFTLKPPELKLRTLIKCFIILHAGTLLKTATLAQGGKQIILQKQGGLGGPGQPQIVTLVKTSQGMQVATMPKGALMQASGSPQGVKTVSAAGAQILQTQAGKTIPQGATIVKLVNAQGGAVGPGGQKIMTTMKTIGGGTNVMTMSKPGGTIMTASPQGMQGQAGKAQTIVINKQGTLKNAQGQQIIVVSTAGGLKTVQTLSQAGGSMGHGNLIQTGSGQGAVKMIVVSSGQLAQTTNRPIAISMPGGSMPKTVTLAHGSRMAVGGGHQLYNASTGQILTLPASNIITSGQLAGHQAGKPFTLQMAGGGQKTLTLVQAPHSMSTTQSSPQVVVASSGSNNPPTITTSHEGPVSSDAALAQLAAEAGLLEGGDGTMTLQMADGTMLDPNSIPVEGGDMQGMQVDGGLVTPPNEVVTYSAGSSDYGSLFFSQVDGADDEVEGDKDASSGEVKAAEEVAADQAAVENIVAEVAGAEHQVETGAASTEGEAEPVHEEEGPSEHVLDELEPMETSDLGSSTQGKESEEALEAVPAAVEDKTEELPVAAAETEPTTAELVEMASHDAAVESSKRDALAEAMEAVTGDLLGDVIDGDVASKDATSDNATDAGNFFILFVLCENCQIV